MGDCFSVAIDGPSGAGKSTIAKALAKQMDIMYLDTGAMYRTVGLAVLRKGISPEDEQQVSGIVKQLPIQVLYQNGEQHMWLDGEDVSTVIREPEISVAASKVSRYPVVRRHMVQLQREVADNTSIVMDGRDIGTVVLPNATLKIFLSASLEERAERRYRELLEKGSQDSYEEVYEALRKRDLEDTTRATDPLRKAEDAVELDTTHMTLEESIDQAIQLLRQRLATGRCSL